MKYKSLLLKIVFLLFVGLVSCKNNNDKTNNISKHKIPVVVETAKPETFKHFINVTANVEAVNYAIISPQTPGQIVQINVVEGQKVNKGDLLFKQNSSVVEGQIQAVKAQLNLAELTYNKQKDLWENKKVGSEIQYLQAKTQYENLKEQLKTLQAQLALTEVKAPFAGIIDVINNKVGEMASPGMPVMQLVNLDKMKIVGEVSEKYLPVVHKGDTVTVSFDTYTNLTVKSPIYRVGNIINPANRTFIVEVRLNNKNHRLKPNMVSKIYINDYTKENAITVPSIIIKKDFEKQFLFIAQKNDSTTIAKKIYVETGRSYKDRTIITKGITPGNKVIVKGYNIVTNGIEIEIK